MIDKSRGDALFLLAGVLVGKLLPGNLQEIKSMWESEDSRPWLVNASLAILVGFVILYLVSRDRSK
jgi:hypothetical protein